MFSIYFSYICRDAIGNAVRKIAPKWTLAEGIVYRMAGAPNAPYQTAGKELSPEDSVVHMYRNKGGGAKCTHGGCTKVDAGGGFCRSHGGGKRCQIETCGKADVGGGYCTRHGGGKRCTVIGCNSTDQGGGKCRSHGGGRRCKEPHCLKICKGREGFCELHGGRVTCSMTRCRKLAVKGQEQCKLHQFVIRKPLGMDGLVAEMKSSVPKDSQVEQNEPRLSMEPIVCADALLAENKDDMAACISSGCNASFGGMCTCTSCSCCPSKADSSKKASIAIPREEIRVDGSGSRLKHCNMKYVMSEKYALPLSGKLKNFKEFLALDMMLDVIALHTVHRTLEFVGLLDCDLISREMMKVSNGFSNCLLVGIEDVACPRTEISVQVSDMMCMANCGTTITKALKKLPVVEAVNIVFESRIVIVTGKIVASWVENAIEGAGYTPEVKSIYEIPSKVMLKISTTQGYLTRHSAAVLCDTISMRNDITNVMWLHENSVLVAQGFATPSSLLAELLDLGYRSAYLINNIEESEHQCVNEICSENGCDKYRANVAHAAALAGGMVVPGCAMAWGGDCTCGDSCKCVDCPTHSIK